MTEVTIKGAEELEHLGRVLRVSDKRFKRELAKAVRDAARPAGEVVRAAYAARLPRSGGLAARIAASAVSARTTTTGAHIGARVTLRNQHSLRSIERGRLRHPVFGNREVWVSQPIPAEIGSTAFATQQSQVQRRVLAAMDRVADQIAKG